VIAAQVLPVSLSMPEKLLTVDDLVPKELVNQLKYQAKYNTRSKPKLEGEDSGNKRPYVIVSNIAFYPSFESVSVLFCSLCMNPRTY